MLKTIQENFGPGLLFAASAVGISHLVQSTQAGAEFGIGMVLVIVLICLVKYPMFLFSARYTAITGDTVITGYEKMGKWILHVIFLVHLLELPFAIAGVSIVTAGVVKHTIGIDSNEVLVAFALVASAIVLLSIGRFRFLETVSKLLVLAFLFCIFAGAMLSLDSAGIGSPTGGSEFTLDSASLLFVVALAGWLPTGVAGAIGMSLWVHAKNQRIGRQLDLAQVNTDFNLGYGIVVLTACCFCILGASIVFTAGATLEGDAAGFAGNLIDVFTQSLGTWAHYLVVIGANVIVISSLLILVDLLPRLSSSILLRLTPQRFSEADRGRLYLCFIGYELISVALIFLLLFQAFSDFISLVTSIGFLAIPVIAWLNHKVIFSPQIAPAKRPSAFLRVWSYCAICLTSVVVIAFLVLKI